MKTQKKTTQFLSTTEFLIPSYTGEYTPTNITTVYDEGDDLDEDLYDDLMDTGITLVYSVNINEALEAYNDLRDQLLEILQEEILVDSDFFDYIPDVVNQMLHIALYYNHNFPKNPILIEDLKKIIQDFDNKRGEQEGHLESSFKFPYEDCTQLIEEQELIQRIPKRI